MYAELADSMYFSEMKLHLVVADERQALCRRIGARSGKGELHGLAKAEAIDTAGRQEKV